eukprot:scaffold74186_cov71-Phaeocystis_antarctica.AAC.4
MVAGTLSLVALLLATASGLLVSLKPSHLSPRAPTLRMAESAKTLREQLRQEGAAYEATTATGRALDTAKAACSRSRYEIESAGAAPGVDRARRGAIQAFCAWAIGPLVGGTAAAMASDGASVSELAERLELYEARARDAERVALAKDAELQQKLAELSQ